MALSNMEISENVEELKSYQMMLLSSRADEQNPVIYFWEMKSNLKKKLLHGMKNFSEKKVSDYFVANRI